MPNPNDLLAQALKKSENVAASADAKRAAFDRQRAFEMAAGQHTGAGMASASQEEADLRTMNPAQLIGKYGDRATAMMGSVINGSDEYNRKVGGERTTSEALADTVTDVGLGIANSVGGIAAFGLGVANDELGMAASNQLKRLNDFGQSTQSNVLQNRREALAARSNMEKRDSTAQFEAEKEDDGAFMAGLRREGRNAMNVAAQTLDDPVTLGSGVSSGVGSLLAGGPVSKALKAFGAGGAAMPLAIGAMEGGGAFAQTNQEVSAMSHEKLMAGSETYRRNIAAGMDQDAAKADVANKSGMFAAAVAGPTGVATGKLVSKFESAPLSLGSTGSKVGNVLREALEEGSQGVSGQLAQNLGQKGYADNTKDALEGVGEQAATGAIFGAGTAGALQVPRTIKDAAVGAVQGTIAAGKAAGKALVKQADALMAKNAKASPNNLDGAEAEADALLSLPGTNELLVDGEAPVQLASNTVTRIREAVAALPSTVEKKDEAEKYLEKLVEVSRYNIDEVDTTGWSAENVEAVRGANNRIAAALKLARRVVETEGDDRIFSAAALYKTIEPILAMQQSDTEGFNSLPQDSVEAVEFQRINTLIANLNGIPEIKQALGIIEQHISAQKNGPVVTAEQVAEPENNKDIPLALAVAALHPEKADLKANEILLKHAENGKLILTPSERTSLLGSSALLRAAQAAKVKAAASGVVTDVDRVANEVVANVDENGKKGLSAAQHTQGVIAAMSAGNTSIARDLMEDLGLFVEHMQNKVAALNEHIAAGEPKAPGKIYQQLQSTRNWKPARKGLAVRTYDANSVAFAQTVEREAKMLSDVYSGLLGAFPELVGGNVAEIAPVVLDALLDGKPADVAKAFAAGTRTAKAKVEKPVVQEKPAPVVEAKSEPEKKAEPVKAAAVKAPEPKKERITPADMTDEQLSDALDLEEDTAVYATLTKEQAKREDAAYEKEQAEKAALAEAEAAKPVPKQMPFVEPVEPIKRKKENIWYADGENSVLSNLHHREFKYKGKQYLSVEHAYQSNKSGRFDQKTYDKYTVAGVKIPGTLGTLTKDDWNMKLMQKLITASFKADTFAAEALLATGDAELTHRQDKGVWQTAFPEMLANTREHLRVASLVPSPMDAAFPDLISHTKNFFKEAFTLPKEPRTRIAGTDAPLSLIRDALESTGALAIFVGGNTNKTITPEIAKAYSRVLSPTNQGGVGHLMHILKGNLATALAESYSKAEPASIGEIFRTGKEIETKNGKLSGLDMNRSADRKVLNITEDVDGTYEYNQELLESAALAAMQWAITANSKEPVMDDEAVEKLTGISGFSNAAKIAELAQGASLSDVLRGMSNKIKQYWNVIENKDVPIGYTDGIPQAMAAELLRGLIELGYIEQINVTLGAADGVSQKDVKTRPDGTTVERVKTIDRYIVRMPEKVNEVYAHPSAIDEAVLLVPTDRSYVGDTAFPPVPEFQMNSSHVPLTPENIQAIKNEQRRVFNIDVPMLNAFTALGKEGMIEMFGAGDISKRLLNRNHRKSLQGINTGIAAAFQAIQNLAMEAGNVAATMGNDLTNVAVRYAYNMSSVGRMQMLGKQNPQANKAMREVSLPTWSTLDLTNPKHEHALWLAIAQAIGVKVHRIDGNVAVAEAKKRIAGPLAAAMDVVGNWAGQTNMAELDGSVPLSKKDIAVLKKAFKDGLKSDITPVAFHALVELNRLQRTSPAEKAAFRTSLYLEADGVNNGAANAIQLMSTGEFTEQYVANSAKTGFTFGEKASNDKNPDTVDLYEEAVNRTQQQLQITRSELLSSKNGAAMAKQMHGVLLLLDSFSDAVSYDNEKTLEKGALTMSRNIAKNPMMVILYGAGLPGIANKITKEIVENIYARMSQVAEAKAANPKITDGEAMFPGDPHGADKARRFSMLLRDLSDMTVHQNFMGEYYAKYPGAHNSRDQGLEDFTLTPDEVAAISKNIETLFVGPLQAGIIGTLGSSVMATARLLQQSTNNQSLGMVLAYQKAMDAKLLEKESDPTWRKGDFLSRNELTELNKSMLEQFPPVKANGQLFNVVKSASADLATTSFARSLDGKFRAAANAYVPAEAGVAGIPYLTIGMGDGRAMQETFLDKFVQGILGIFDGLHMPLDKITEYGEIANKSVHTSWQGNQVSAVLASFKTFVEGLGPVNRNGVFESVANMTKQERAVLMGNSLEDQKIKSEIAEQTKEAEKLGQPVNLELFTAKAEATAAVYVGNMYTTIQLGLIEEMGHVAAEIDIRHAVVRTMPNSVDQMAGASSPYHNGVSSVGSNITNAEIAAEMEKRRQALIPKKVGQLSEFAKGKKAAGVTVITGTGLKKLAKNIPDYAQAVYGEILRSGALDGYTVVSGHGMNVRAYAEKQGVTLPVSSTGETLHGVTVPSNKTIYIMSDSVETLVHELVHAATFASVLAHYEGKSEKVVADAIARLEQLMHTFRNTDTSSFTQKQLTAYNNAVAEINEVEADVTTTTEVAKAKALNEFMAWSLANQQLAKKLQTAAVPVLVQLATAAVQFIKKLVWGRKVAPTTNSTFFDSLVFNSAIVIRNQGNTSVLARNVTVNHSTRAGVNSRLLEVQRAYNKAVTDYTDTLTLASARTAPQVAADISLLSAGATKVATAAGFSMNAQEQATFTGIIGALATEASINPTALAQAQTLYNHVAKTLSVEDFLKNPTSTDPQELHRANAMYSVIVGKSGIGRDALGRSTLLPMFIALATVNDDFRDVLKKVAVPAAQKNLDTTVDALLENQGDALLDSLSQRMSGQRSAGNVAAALDGLQAHIVADVLHQKSVLENGLDTIGNFSDKANQAIVAGLTQLSDSGVELGKKLQTSASPFVANAGKFVQLTASIINETNAASVAEGVSLSMDSANAWEPFRKLVSDLIGRSAGNARVYDMIKSTRAAIHQLRQQFREGVPAAIASKFTRELGDAEYSVMYKALGKTDIAALFTSFKANEIVKLLSDSAARDAEIKKMEQALGANRSIYKRKAEQLAKYMMTGIAKTNLQRNATAIAGMFGTNKKIMVTADMENNIDMLTSLYALDLLKKEEKTALSVLVQKEKAGLEFVVSYLNGQRREEQAKTSGIARANYYKGHMPTTPTVTGSLIVAEDADFPELSARSYERVGGYKGSGLESNARSRSYYFSPVNAKAAFSQGIMQNVRKTASGVDARTGFSVGMTAGVITSPAQVRQISLAISKGLGNVGVEALVPVFDENGAVFAYERSVNPMHLDLLKNNTHIGVQIGAWRGRQVEEKQADIVNAQLIKNLHAMYVSDIAKSSGNQSAYVNLLAVGNSDPVIADAVALFTAETREAIKDEFGDEFYVRKSMIDDAVGYRNATVGDLWTGNSRLSERTRETIRNLAMTVYGNKAYAMMVRGEKVVQNFVDEARTNIVVKSVVVPLSNFASNIVQMIMRGVPIASIAKSMPSKLVEIEMYTKGRLEQINLEAELRAATTTLVRGKLQARLKSIDDSYKRLSIWPLIEAGEFSSVSDVGINAEDVELASGKLVSFLEQQVDKLPESVKTLGRYGFVTRDTALFRGLQKSVQYGDFIAKAVMYDDLVKRKGMNSEAAIAAITEEFINYDRLTGRGRGYLESIGMMWFYNYKIRATKVGLSMLRNNPLHVLLGSMLPVPSVLSVGSPISDNILSKGAAGELPFSLGPEQGLGGMMMNPWLNVVN